MATRKISSTCLATSSRISIISSAVPRQQPRSKFPVGRYLQTSAIRFVQKANTSAKRDPAPKVIRGESKLFKDADAAVADLSSGSTILSAGFGLAGTAGEIQ